MLAISTPPDRARFGRRNVPGLVVETSGDGVVAGGGVIILPFQPHPIDPRPQRGLGCEHVYGTGASTSGPGRRLVQTMVKWCSAEGMRYLYLHASDDGRPLYESMGFKSTNEMRLAL